MQNLLKGQKIVLVMTSVVNIRKQLEYVQIPDYNASSFGATAQPKQIYKTKYQ